MSATIFTIKRSEIEGRLDPLFYKAVLRIEKEIISHSKYDVFKVRDVCSITRGRFGHRPRNDPAYYGGKYPFIQTGDIVKASDFDTEIEFSQTLNELGLSTSRLFKSPKLLFTIAANIGDTAILTYDSCFPDSIVALDVNENITNIDYLNIYFKIIKPYIYDLAPFSAQRNLNNKQLEEIPLIIPPKLVQQKIINIYRTVQIERREKYKQAKQLLDSIDSYLLSELGIKLPQKDNSLSKRIFTTKFSEVSGGRWDPFWQISQKNKMKSNNFSEVKVKELANIQKGESITSDEIKEGNFPVIAGGKTSPYSHNVSNFNGNVITISASGAYSGYVWYHKKPIFASDCSVLTSLDESNCTTLFLYEVLHLKQEELYNLQQGAGQPHVYPDDIAEIKIPLPPLPKQKEIASHIREIREQAKQLQVEAEQTMQEAKKQIEKMILGE